MQFVLGDGFQQSHFLSAIRNTSLFKNIYLFIHLRERGGGEGEGRESENLKQIPH